MLKEDPLRELLSGGERKKKESERKGKEWEEGKRWRVGLQEEKEKEGRERKAERRGGQRQSSCTLS